MKFSISLLILASACLCVAARTQTNYNLRRVERELEESIVNPSYDQIATADAISRAIEVVSPIARDALAAGLKIAVRLYNGGSNSKKNREYENQLLARIDKIISDVNEGKSITDVLKIPVDFFMHIFKGFRNAINYIKITVPIELQHDFTFFATIGRLILGGFANAAKGVVADVQNLTNSNEPDAPNEE